jgi:hypothetical protein
MMSLVSYSDVRPGSIDQLRVINRRYRHGSSRKALGFSIHQRSVVGDREIDTIVKWIDAGRPRRPKDSPPKQWPSGDRFSLEQTLGRRTWW